jgi:hypothetical protein
MTRGKWLLAVLIMGLAVGCGGPQSPGTTPKADTPENRKLAAERYLQAVPPRDLLHNMEVNMARRIPPPRRRLFMEAMSDKELEQAAYRIILAGLVQHFTPQELNAMAAFYGSPEGKSIQRKFGPYMADIMPQISGEVRKVLVKKEEQAQPGGEKTGPAPGAAGKPAPAKPEPPQAAPAKPAPPQPGQAPAELPKPAPPQGK